ncbi:Hsp70 family protein [Aspergillus mulundensis]|uniref:Hsp70 family chaperone n=1 Tax=Aspergillus mulundensis TaxID=1810919 RepID=A0A3D8RER3_9EURO|nr:Uncharacterized protein DSM5745_07516 [Aspergillus mulundensis]RDW72344.1 Uncharacterized protein DSM5745_07516 [Aspergillus mulundensis]
MDEKEALGPPVKVNGSPSTWVEERFPDIVVGIDFGMTCTGVAYSTGPDWGPPKTIQRWPGKLLSELANKAPTSLVYSPDGKILRDWGFGCDTEDRSADIKEFFKLHLTSQSEFADLGLQITQAEARRWFQDYISCIYRHVLEHLTGSIPGFETMRVEFMFSVPTTWKDVRVIEEIRALLDKAVHRPNHWACIALTEAEAAAVYACRGYYQPGNIVLVCDSGGGTTVDVNVLRLLSARGEPVQLEQLGSVEGRPIGSVFIDRAIHKLIAERLSKATDHLLQTPEYTAWKMISGRFQRLKCAFGTDAAKTPFLSLDVPFLKDQRVDLPEAGISNGSMRIEWEHVRSAFDTKINEMCELLDGQIQQMQTRHPLSQISYIVLSGGFGSSPYVKTRLHTRYAMPGLTKHANILGAQLLLAEEPQLAVVHGLVLERTQQLHHGLTSLGARCSPVSYGIICDQLYDAAVHLGQRVRRDPRDNNLYAVEQIEWLVVAGQPVPPCGISKAFQLKIMPGDEASPWKAHIVSSLRRAESLARSVADPGVERVCSLDISTEDVERKVKNGKWYNVRPRYCRATFEVRVVVGAADLSFQLWSRDRRVRVQGGHEPIRVQWMPAGPG